MRVNESLFGFPGRKNKKKDTFPQIKSGQHLNEKQDKGLEFPGILRPKGRLLRPKGRLLRPKGRLLRPKGRLLRPKG
eukprot:CAMPEP_0196652026 /NCGR_PEP_ID=MMETSP1086-20130531/1224_1 /TAXON_ID=77921 /ORGANISM="Cyanoptyche  gloeocystis , Strain SAG4.97" /LENGTH=76 /DNA_ID=CAMNT_0041982363 /DNA_START=137 /DNA_END=363 /DNA_ORIENTATION=-